MIISELLVNDEKTGPVPVALLSLNMLLETKGRNYTPAEYGVWLDELGFRDIRTHRLVRGGRHKRCGPRL